MNFQKQFNKGLEDKHSWDSKWMIFTSFPTLKFKNKSFLPKMKEEGNSGAFFFFFDISVGFIKGRQAVCFLYYLKYGQVKNNWPVIWDSRQASPSQMSHMGLGEG